MSAEALQWFAMYPDILVAGLENRLTLFPRARTTDHMHMQMLHLLPSLVTGVDHHPEPALRVRIAPLLQGQLRHQGHDLAHECRVLILQMSHGRDVGLGNDQKMHRRPRVDVVKGINFVIFINLATGDVALGDFAKNTVGIVRHERIDGE